MSTNGAPVIELGNAVMLSRRIGVGIDQIAKDVLNHDIDKTKEMLDNLKDMHYVEECHIIEGPSVDKLQRFRSLGWYGKISSPGYTKLQEHFKCRQEHIPYKITWKFIWRMTKTKLKGNQNDY